MSQMLMPILLCFGVFYFIILRPEKKQRAARQAMLAALRKGDKVLTTSGMYGTIVQVQDQVVTVQVAENVRMRMALSAIQSVEAEEEAKPAVETK
jgi:preprotein translocase subunit YajC